MATPTKLVTDCETGATVEVALTAAEQTALAAGTTALTAEAAARDQRLAAFQARFGDVQGAYTTMVNRLEQIQTQMSSSPTNAQVVAAVRDLALGQERLLKLVAALVQAG